jgi:hypothetical protein
MLCLKWVMFFRTQYLVSACFRDMPHLCTLWRHKWGPYCLTKSLTNTVCNHLHIFITKDIVFIVFTQLTPASLKQNLQAVRCGTIVWVTGCEWRRSSGANLVLLYDVSITADESAERFVITSLHKRKLQGVKALGKLVLNIFASIKGFRQTKVYRIV